MWTGKHLSATRCCWEWLSVPLQQLQTLLLFSKINYHRLIFEKIKKKTKKTIQMLVQAAVLIVSIFENMRLTPRSSFNCQNKDEKKKK